MSLIKNIESKMKLTFWVAIGSFIMAIIISIIAFSYAQKMVTSERNQIYVLDNNVPLVAKHTMISSNRKAEFKALISHYHNLFFTLPPDDDYIQKKLAQAMYLIDKSGLAQYNTLKEKNYFNSLISTTTFVTVTMDSIKLDMNTLKWTYFGTEKIERPSDITIRNLITTGNIQNILGAKGVPIRSENNPYGAIITHWHIIQNKDIRHETKRIY